MNLRAQRDRRAAGLAQDANLLPADFSLWPSGFGGAADPGGILRAGQAGGGRPQHASTGKRYWIDVVVSNDGTIRIDRIVPAGENKR